MAVITPEKLAEPGTESAHQQALFCALAIERFQHKRLLLTEWLHHIPNGGERDKAVAGKLKAEGVKSGVWDLHLPVPAKGFHGLYIEMKKPEAREEKNGGLSGNQIKFGEFVKPKGFCCRVCYSWQEAFAVIKWYLWEYEWHGPANATA